MLFLFGVFLVFSIPNSKFVDYNLSEKNNQSQKKLYDVEYVVDGDTFKVKIDHKEEKIRILGLNTPEAYNFKDRKRECFGKEASAKAKEILKNQKVFLELDNSQSKVDKYGRLLRHVFLEDGTNFAELMIKEGYGFEYTYHGLAHKYQTSYREAQKEAQKAKKGLWGKKCNGQKDL